MFSRRTMLSAAAMVTVAFATTTAQAQSGPSNSPATLTPSAKPVTSPYLNLAIDNQDFGSATYQYFQQVKPRLEMRRENRRLENELRQMQRRMNETSEMDQSPASGLGTTGHTTGFQAYGNFFPAKRRR